MSDYRQEALRSPGQVAVPQRAAGRIDRSGLAQNKQNDRTTRGLLSTALQRFPVLRHVATTGARGKLAPLFVFLLLSNADKALAQVKNPVQSVTVFADPVNNAVDQAPSQASLSVTQPTSILSSQFIRNSIPPQSDYSQVVALSPSAYTVNQNGPGGAFASRLSIRGFQDGQYNVTLDGVPFGDSNNYTHHTSAYFMNRDLAQVGVDRGPGTASTIGNATFGGTISLVTRDPADVATLTPYASGGSFGTTLFGGQLDTGALPGGGHAIFDGESTSTDGALTYDRAKRTNVFGKFIQPIGADTTVTLEGMYNTTQQFYSRGVSRAQIAQFGSNFAFNNDPKSADYYKFWVNNTRSDFEYLRVQSRLSEHWSIDDSVYTYYYGLKGTRPTDQTNMTYGTIYGGRDVPGILSNNQYRAFGNVVQLKRTFSIAGIAGDLKFGGWIEHQGNAYKQANADLTLGNKLTPNNLSAFLYLDHEDLMTVQPYVELDIEPIPGLIVTPGLKYDFFNRDVHAIVNTGGGSLDYARDYRAPLPAVTAHYMIRENWSAYLQYAKGFQMPDLNYIQVADPSKTTVSPQQTDNYQIGTAWQDHRLSLSADLYYIDFGNMVGSRTFSDTTVYFNQGQVDYYGVEAEATLNIGHGINLYANASGNEARARQNDKPIANNPEATAAAGILYASPRWNASLIDKWVGARYGDTGLKQGLQPFNQLDLSISTILRSRGGKKWKLTLQVDNLLDSHKIVGFDLYSGKALTPIYYTQAGRSAFVSLELPL